MKKVEIPSYWKEEEYQPLVETQTFYGNKIMVPQKFHEACEVNLKGLKSADKARPNGQTGLEIMKENMQDVIENRGKKAADLAKVLLEIYHE